MEDLNNLLNGGEVPNLFPPDERLQVSNRKVLRFQGLWF